MFIRELFRSILRIPGEFADVAMHDPLSAVLLAFGGIITLLTIGYFSLLFLGAVLSLFKPSPGGRPQQPGR